MSAGEDKSKPTLNLPPSSATGQTSSTAPVSIADGSGASAGKMKRSASAGDIVWLRHQGRRLSTEFNFGEDFEEVVPSSPVTTGLEDSFGGLGLSKPSKASLWAKSKPIHPIMEEGSIDDSSVGMASNTNPVTQSMGRRTSMDAAMMSQRGSQKIEKPKCSQSVMMRWLATSAVPPGAKLPPALGQGAKGEKPCKDLAFAFKSRDINAVTPTNW